MFDSAKRVEKAFNKLEVTYMSDQELAGISLGKNHLQYLELSL